MPDSKLKVYPILLAGGSGTRLWPVSRELFPKQLVKFIGQDSLVQATIKRLAPVLNVENTRIVCGKEHYHEIAKMQTSRRVQREEFISEVIETLRKALAKQDIKAEISGRPKHLYSIYQKIQKYDREGKRFDDIGILQLAYAYEQRRAIDMPWPMEEKASNVNNVR